MKLYLSSYRIPEFSTCANLFDKPIGELSGLVITNAKENRSPEEQNRKFESLRHDLAGLGLAKIVFQDVRKLMRKADAADQLEDYNYIYAAGGNTFDLVKAITESGFEGPLRHFINEGRTYIGESAGAIAIGPSLAGFNTTDEQKDASITKGLGLIDTIIVPHNDSLDARYTDRAKYIQELNPGCNVLPLNDNQALVINGRASSVVSGSL